MQEQIFDMLLKEEEIGWKTILYDLVKTEQMDPWDINITLLTQKYIEVIRGMQEHDLRVSGKIVLAAAVLLKLKSAHLLNKDIVLFDSLLHDTEEEIDEDFEEHFEKSKREKQQYTLIPRNPQPRNRKVSIHDLVNALQRAMASKKKILARIKPVNFKMPDKNVDIMEVIRDVYHKIQYYDKKGDDVTFSRLLPPRAEKTDKVYTFLPLLHLENQQKIDIKQEKAFDEIYVKLKKG